MSNANQSVATLPTFRLALDFTQSDIAQKDYFTLAKPKVCEGVSPSGHKAFLWAWLDRYSDEDVRIAIHLLSPWETPALLLELETAILRATEPPYNVQIPPER